MATASSTKEKVRTKLKVPKRYNVVMHNDDFTPMNFVVEILIQLFNKGNDEAVLLMLTVHRRGKSSCRNLFL